MNRFRIALLGITVSVVMQVGCGSAWRLPSDAGVDRPHSTDDEPTAAEQPEADAEVIVRLDLLQPEEGGARETAIADRPIPELDLAADDLGRKDVDVSLVEIGGDATVAEPVDGAALDVGIDAADVQPGAATCGAAGELIYSSADLAGHDKALEVLSTTSSTCSDQALAGPDDVGLASRAGAYGSVTCNPRSRNVYGNAIVFRKFVDQFGSGNAVRPCGYYYRCSFRLPAAGTPSTIRMTTRAPRYSV